MVQGFARHVSTAPLQHTKRGLLLPSLASSLLVKPCEASRLKIASRRASLCASRMFLIAFRHGDAASLPPCLAHSFEKSCLPVIVRPVLFIAKVQALGLFVSSCEDVRRDGFTAIITGNHGAHLRKIHDSIGSYSQQPEPLIYLRRGRQPSMFAQVSLQNLS